MKKILILSFIVAVISSCSSVKNSADTHAVTLTGQITPSGMTTFQYGTHLIKAENKLYALKSSKVNLDNYADKSVTLKGTKVSGYPLEGGPELIEVSEVSIK
jgi:hypothetical protein